MQEANQKIIRRNSKIWFYFKYFREHNPAMLGKKKGNVDSDIIFIHEKNYIDEKIFNKIIIVSGDGDYKLMIDF